MFRTQKSSDVFQGRATDKQGFVSLLWQQKNRDVFNIHSCMFRFGSGLPLFSFSCLGVPSSLEPHWQHAYRHPAPAEPGQIAPAQHQTGTGGSEQGRNGTRTAGAGRYGTIRAADDTT